MSSSRARRTFVPTSTVAPPQQQSQESVNTPGLTLPQVISLIDTRLITLEQFMKEQKTTSAPANASVINSDATAQLHEEYNHRFEILTEEIMAMKDLLLKLQSYTMDVNKALYEERIHVFSDLGGLGNSDDGEAEAEVETEVETAAQGLKNLINGVTMTLDE